MNEIDSMSIGFIEKALGIDLITLFDALSQGVFYKNRGAILRCDKPKLIANITYVYSFKDPRMTEKWQYASSYSLIVNKSGLCVQTSSYGDKWALTEEELK